MTNAALKFNNFFIFISVQNFDKNFFSERCEEKLKILQKSKTDQSITNPAIDNLSAIALRTSLTKEFAHVPNISKIVSKTRMTTKQVNAVFGDRRKRNKEQKYIIEEYGKPSEIEVDGVRIYMCSLKSAFDFRKEYIKQKLLNFDLVFSRDCGNNITKISFFIANVEDCQSPDNYSVLAYWARNISDNLLKHVIPKIDSEIKEIQQEGNIKL